MAGERRYIPASEFCASVRDGTHDSPKPVQNGRKLVTSRHLTTGRLDLTDAYLISEEDFEAINKRSKVDRWDVLISMIGTVGEPCLIKEEPDFAIKNIGLFKTKGEADGKWLYYFLRSKDAQQSIREQSRGTTQQYIPLGALRDFPILVAEDPEEQKAIAAVLGALDDKIELNRRMNATLEAMARALFQSWFVDFDPVRAKLDGRPPPPSTPPPPPSSLHRSMKQNSATFQRGGRLPVSVKWRRE
jgi:type I restriction enzyme S subunit